MRNESGSGLAPEDIEQLLADAREVNERANQYLDTPTVDMQRGAPPTDEQTVPANNVPDQTHATTTHRPHPEQSEQQRVAPQTPRTTTKNKSSSNKRGDRAKADPGYSRVIKAVAILAVPFVINSVAHVAKSEEKDAKGVIEASAIGIFDTPFLIADLFEYSGDKLAAFIKKQKQGEGQTSTSIDDLTRETPSPAPPVSPIPKATVTEKASTTPSPSPSPSPSPTEKTNSTYPKVLEDGIIAGNSAFYSPPMTAEVVRRYETCFKVSEGIVLTFDDSGSLATVKKIVNVLDEKKVGAAFFPNTGSGLFADPKIVKWLRDKGYYVGNHTANHDNLVNEKVDQNDPVAVKNNVDAIVEKIKSGGDANLFRPPYGATRTGEDGRIYFDTNVYEAMLKTGVNGCMWDIDTGDYRDSTTADDIVKTVQNRLTPNSVVLAHMHDDSKIAEALGPIIDNARAEGKEFISNPGKPTLADFNKMPIGSK